MDERGPLMGRPDGRIFSAQFRAAIGAALARRRVRHRCPACGGRDFALLDGYTNCPVLAVHDERQHFAGRGHRPAVAVECQRCGLLLWHALGALGLRPEGLAVDYVAADGAERPDGQ